MRTDDTTSATDPEKVGRSFQFVLAVFLTILVTTLAVTYAGRLLPSPIARDGQAATVLWPQGWSFFDRVADDETVVVYRSSAAVSPVRVTSIQMSTAGRWGLSRAAIRQVAETQDILDRVPARSWIDCGATDPTTCLRAAASGERLRMTATIAAPTLCGAFVLSVEAPQRRTPAFRVRAVVAVQVDCVAR